MPHPQRSRDRHRGYERDRAGHRERDKERQRGKEKDVDRRRQQRRQRDDYEEVDAGDGEGRDEEDEEEDDESDDAEDDSDDVFDDNRRRARRQHQPSRSRTRERRYDPHDSDEYDENDDHHDDDRHNNRRHRRDENVIFVDSRPGFARPPAPRAPPTRESPRGGGGNGERSTYQHHKAKESPATSPIKKRDRERDREGRRRRDSTADEATPTKAGRLRDRRANRDSDHVRGATRSGGEERDAEAGKRAKRREQKKKDDKSKHASADSANSATQLLNADALARLNARNQKTAEKEEKARAEQERKRKSKEKGGGGGIFGFKLRGRDSSAERNKKASKKRLVSGAALEEGRSPELKVRGGRRDARNEKWRKGGGGGDDDGGGSKSSSKWSRKKKICIAVAAVALLLIIVIPVAVVISKKAEDDGSDPADPATSTPSNDELDNLDPNSIPADAKGTYYDPFNWYDTSDFNVTYTEEKVGGLPVMGLNSTWDDSARANENVPALNEEFPYGDQPIRGVNVGGWLVVEPFITPSFFEEYSDDVIDDWTLAKSMGATAKNEFEKHYATFITEQSFKEIRDAGFDHVRIPYGYWAVTTYDGDPYVPMVSWRYLLRAIEYCRKYGLRVSLDLHAAPGSQNGWNHSGHESKISWLNGTDGDLNAQRTLDIHDQLSQFFAQPRYKNVIAMYGLVNEPMMLKLEIEPVLDWTTKAAEIVAKNGMDQHIVFGDGFLKLSKWTTMLQDTGFNLVLDTHQYTIFNSDLIKLTHQEKLEFVCDKWTDLISDSNSGGDKGWGPTICGEWSQADTDCAKFLNNVGAGARWTGTMNDPNGRTDVVLEPQCPTQAGDDDSGKACSCGPAIADPSDYSESYKTFLRTYAEAQISAFETAWGWFYWTWETETATQWSWRKGLAAGILPEKAYAPAFKCGDDYPDLSDLPEYY